MSMFAVLLYGTRVCIYMRTVTLWICKRSLIMGTEIKHCYRATEFYKIYSTRNQLRILKRSPVFSVPSLLGRRPHTQTWTFA